MKIFNFNLSFHLKLFQYVQKLINSRMIEPHYTYDLRVFVVRFTLKHP